jgi:hypothetical protein
MCLNILSREQLVTKRESLLITIGYSLPVNYEDNSGERVGILGGHNIGHSKQESVYVHVFYSEWFPRYNKRSST